MCTYIYIYIYIYISDRQVRACMYRCNLYAVRHRDKYMYVRVYIYTYVCNLRVCIHVCVCVCVYACMFVCSCEEKRLDSSHPAYHILWACVRTYVCTYVCMCIGDVHVASYLDDSNMQTRFARIQPAIIIRILFIQHPAWLPMLQVWSVLGVDVGF